MVKIDKAAAIEATRFLEATDGLFQGISHQDLADEMDCSVALIRQARRHPDTAAFRTPPAGWKVTVRRLLEQRAQYLSSLAKRLKTEE